MTREELLSDLGDYLRDWIDGDDPVDSVSVRPYDAEMFVMFENEQLFLIKVEEL